MIASLLPLFLFLGLPALLLLFATGRAVPARGRAGARPRDARC